MKRLKRKKLEISAEAARPFGKGSIVEKLDLMAGRPSPPMDAVAEPAEDGGSLTHKTPVPGEGGDEGPQGWQMAVEYRPGARILAGTLPRAAIKVTISDPWGNASIVFSGSKPEHGPGGFEVLAPYATTYTLTFLDQRFQVETHEGATFVTFREGEPGPGEEPGEDGGNKLGFYVEAGTTPGLADAIRAVQPPTILVHAHDRGLLQAIRRELSPDSFVVGRLYFGPGQQDAWLDSGDPVGAGRALADMILGLDMGLALERGANGRLLIDAWMSLNECLPGTASAAWQQGTPEERQRIRRRASAYDRLMVAFRTRLKEVDEALEAVAFNFGAGNFPHAAAYLKWFPATLNNYRYLGFHEYGWPALSPHLDPEAVSSAGSYRQVMSGIRQALGPHHQAIITEAGLARLYKYPTSPAGDVGWLYPGETISQAAYWQSLAWYNGLLCQDSYALGACLFEVGHSGRWETFRHLGVDNAGHPLQIIPWIQGLRPQEPRATPSAAPVREPRPPLTLWGRIVSHGQPVEAATVCVVGTADTLGADPNAVAYNASAVTWSQAISGFEGSLWNCWQRFVSRSVAAITWEEFRAQAGSHNPSLHENDNRLEAARTYFLPENPPGAWPGILWDRQIEGLSGDRWACWKRYVRGKVVGLTWPAFRQQVAAHNPALAYDGYRFVPSRAYRLPRNTGQELYNRVSLSDAEGWYRFEGLAGGRYHLEVAAKGYAPLRQEIEVDPATRCDLELAPAG